MLLSCAVGMMLSVPSAPWMVMVMTTSSCTWSGQHHAQRGPKQRLRQHVLGGAKEHEQQHQRRRQQELRGPKQQQQRAALRGAGQAVVFWPSAAAWVDRASRRVLVVVVAALLCRLSRCHASLLSSLCHSRAVKCLAAVWGIVLLLCGRLAWLLFAGPCRLYMGLCQHSVHITGPASGCLVAL